MVITPFWMIICLSVIAANTTNRIAQDIREIWMSYHRSLIGTHLMKEFRRTLSRQ